MNRILLIRHASVDHLGQFLYGRTPGIHLSDAGRREAQALAEALKRRFRIEATVSSPLERAAETAQAIAKLQSTDVLIDEGFTELDFGAWMGKRFSELNEAEGWREYNRLRSLSSAPGGELLADVQARAWKSLRGLDEQYKDATLAIVTHGDVVRALLMLLLGMPTDHILRLEIAPASVSEIVMAREPVVRAVNQILC